MKLIPHLLKDLATGDTVTYRGQADKSWNVMPRVGRPCWGMQAHTDNLAREQRALDHFKKRACHLLQYEPKSDIVWLALMQHHGCATRLLDFTTNPLVALFFASESCPDGNGGALITAEFIPKSSSPTSEEIWGLDSFAYFPAHVTGRIVGQSACFICCGRPHEPLSGQKITTHHIPEKQKKAYRKELEILGITHSLLFPGLDGICADLNIHLEEDLENDSEESI